MITSVVLARQITFPHLPDRANSFPLRLLQPLELSCLSFCKGLPLFSTACRLFCKNTGGRVSRNLDAHSSSGHESRAATFLFVLCFHIDTHYFSHNPFILTPIQIGRGYGCL